MSCGWGSSSGKFHHRPVSATVVWSPEFHEKTTSPAGVCSWIATSMTDESAEPPKDVVSTPPRTTWAPIT